MQSILAGMAADLGAPMVKRILQGKLGDTKGALAGQVIDRIAEAVGATPTTLDQVIADRPADVVEAITSAEREAPEMLASYAAGLEGQFALAQAEMAREHWISWAWRPAAMWGFGVLWFWNLVILHVANAYWKIALPQTDLSVLFQLNAVYMGLYMGGHTLKDFAATRWGTAR